MNILFVGDLVGKPGIDSLELFLPRLEEEYKLDFVIVNAENVSRGIGITKQDYQRLCDFGIDAITLGNHYRGKYEIDRYIESADKLIRPYNLFSYNLGVGTRDFTVKNHNINVTNLLGQAFLKESVPSPIEEYENLLKNLKEGIRIVDFHAESTSEKAILAKYFDGKVTAVLGTHTHVQTNDDMILPNGTAFISDVGFCGSYDSVIGFNNESVINSIVRQNGKMFVDKEVKTLMLNAVLLRIENYRCVEIKKIRLIGEKNG